MLKLMNDDEPEGWGLNLKKISRRVAPKPRGPLWKTKEGYVIPVRKMSTPHLQNAIAFLRRRKHQMELEILRLPEPRGEHAFDAYMNAIERILDAEFSEVFPILLDMEAELEKRKEKERVEFFNAIGGDSK